MSKAIDPISSVIIAGAGNVGTHLGKAFSQKGIRVKQVYSRTVPSAQQLAEKLECSFTTSIRDINQEADAIILSISDSAVTSFLQELGETGMILIHTAGSLPLSILQPFSSRSAVMYPLQTFTRDLELDLSEVPFFLEASSGETLDMVGILAKTITSRVIHLNSEDRLKLHLSAVFCNNFSNQMMSLAYRWMELQHLPFDYLHQLISETARKAILIGPMEAQTGPALRGNNELLQLHSHLLSDFPDYQKLYTFVSNSIQELHRVHKKTSE